MAQPYFYLKWSVPGFIIQINVVESMGSDVVSAP